MKTQAWIGVQSCVFFVAFSGKLGLPRCIAAAVNAGGKGQCSKRTYIVILMDKMNRWIRKKGCIFDKSESLKKIKNIFEMMIK